MGADPDTQSVSIETVEGVVRQFAPGDRIDQRFEIVRHLGRGGFADVFEARDLHLGHHVALKILHRNRASPEQLVRLKREVRIAREIEHPNLVRIFEIFTGGNLAYITMELIEGETLRERLDRSGPLDLEETLTVSSQLLSALQALHKAGVVHRDVKPSNVLITPDGRVKLADLGLARVLAAEETEVTASGSTVGTYEYISPEQAICRPVDGRADLYSCGLLIYEMIAGRRPFDSRSRVGFVAAHLTETPKPVHHVAPGTPRWLSRLVARLLEKRPQDRYGSAGEVLADIDRRSARFRRKPILAVALAAILGSTALMAWHMWQSSRFERIIDGNRHGIIALDRAGRVLWSDPEIPGIRQVSFRLRGRSHLAAFRALDSTNDLEDRYDLLVIDPQSGTVRQTIRMPSAANEFPEFPDDFVPERLTVVDLDSDGNDEIVIDYTHTYWPSFSVVWEPVTGRKVVALVASGHHRFIGAEDLTGDGLDELIYFGINNRMGYLRTLAAVEPRLDQETISHGLNNGTPDRYWSEVGGRGRVLLWYSLLPRDVSSVPEPEITDTAVHVRLDDGSILKYQHDGFQKGSSEISAEARAIARDRAYARVRDALRSLETQLPSEALEALPEAINAAREAQDPQLEEFARTLLVRSRIRSGDHDRAEIETRRLVEGSRWPGDIHWAAATEYHLTGYPEKAVEHYRMGLFSNMAPTGRAPYEFAEGALLAYLEMGDPAGAAEIAGLLRRVDPSSTPQSECMSQWVSWSRTREVRPDNLTDGICTDGVYRYWLIEMRRSYVSPRQSMSELERLANEMPGLRPMTSSLYADLLYEEGRIDEALAIGTRAYEQMLENLDEDRVVRGHAWLIKERYLRSRRAHHQTSSE